jgi:hypothetical protein
MIATNLAMILLLYGSEASLLTLDPFWRAMRRGSLATFVEITAIQKKYLEVSAFPTPSFQYIYEMARWPGWMINIAR